MDIYALLLIGALIFCLVLKTIGIIQMVTYRLPEWHGKHGQEYVNWKKMTDDVNKPTQSEPGNP